MTLTNYAKQIMAYKIGSPITNNIQTFAVGPGSQTISASMTTLTGSEFLRFGITGSPDFTTAYAVTFTGDIDSVQASGLVLKQFGNFESGAINVGSAWSVNQLNGSLVCDGTIELQFQASYTVN